RSAAARAPRRRAQRCRGGLRLARGAAAPAAVRGSAAAFFTPIGIAMTHRLAWTACAVFLCSIGASAAASDMAPGAWEYTMKTSVPGVPVSTPGVTARICLSEKDVPYAMATTGPGSKGDCRYENLRSAGGKTRYDMVCQ